MLAENGNVLNFPFHSTTRPSMGMFDYLRCDYPLPVPAAQGCEFQTKSFKNPSMDTYIIRSDGTLAHVDYDIEDHSNHTAPGMAQFHGSMTRVRLREVTFDFSGKVHFSALYGNPRHNRAGIGHVRFEALFKSGRLVSMAIDSHMEPADVLAAKREHKGLDTVLPRGDRGVKPGRL